MKYLIFGLLSCAMLPLMAQQRALQGLVNDDMAYEKASLHAWSPGTRIGPSATLRQFCPEVQDQGTYNNCVGWAVAYGARTIIEARRRQVTRPDLVNALAFSPGFTYRLAVGSQGCGQGSSIMVALKSLTEIGAIPYSQAKDPCPGRLNPAWRNQASQFRMGGYQVLFYANHPAYEKTDAIRQAIAEGQPVIMGMNCPPSFENADGVALWVPTENPARTVAFGHAMCIVAYDNEKYGGAFQVMNSWGTSWGQNGFIWIRYTDLNRWIKYALVMQEAKPAVSNVPYRPGIR